MSKKSKFYWAAFAAICMVSMLFLFIFRPFTTNAAGIGFVVLDSYAKTMKIGEESYLIAVTSTGKKPTFSSSDSKIASVNTYGKITAKKAGTVKITVKIRNGEASCKVYVKKTSIQLDRKTISLEVGERRVLTAKVSTAHSATFRSNKKSVAAVEEDGTITAKKPGNATITVSADNTSVSCKVTVKKPTVSLNRKSVSLYRRGVCRLILKSSSKSVPVWKSNKKSVAVVDGGGNVTAVKHGTATITVTVDGVSKSCEVTVKQPTVRFEETEIHLKPGETYQIAAQVSSGNVPEYSSSNTCIVTVAKNGKLHAVSSGKAYVYAKEDGIRARIRVVVE